MELCPSHKKPVHHHKDCYIEWLEMAYMVAQRTVEVMLKRNDNKIIIEPFESKEIEDLNLIGVVTPNHKTNEVIWELIPIPEDMPEYE